MEPSSTNAPHHCRRPLSPVSVGDICNRINKVSFEPRPTHGARIRNRSAEPRQLDKPHDNRPPSVNAIRSVVPDRSHQDQIPICSRPDAGGTKGHRISLYTNHFQCHLPDDLAIVSAMFGTDQRSSPCSPNRISTPSMSTSSSEANGAMPINVSTIVSRSSSRFFNARRIICHSSGKHTARRRSPSR